MNSKNPGGILDKINELRALFIFGQRVIPFLEELFYFVHDIVPVLEEINVSIYESANKMPRASSQLDKVTHATEIATTEILDNLDGVLGRLDTIDSHFVTATSDIESIGKLDDRVMEIVMRSEGNLTAGQVNEIKELHEKKMAHLKAVSANADGLSRSLKDIRARSNEIMISLQVQDITSQQIASVNHLIESVQKRLSSLIDKYKANGADLFGEIGKLENQSYDPDATYDRSGARQKTADDILRRANSFRGKLENLDAGGTAGPTSQDEIDKLFQKGA